MIRTVAVSVCVLVLVCGGCARQTADELFEQGMAAAADSTTFPAAQTSFAQLLKRYPDDPRNEQVLFKLAQMAQVAEKHREAIALYERLVTGYPQSEKAYQAQFMVGFLYEEKFGDTTNARIAYQKVLDNYPDSDLARDARISILHLGKKPEEWITFEAEAPQPPAAVQ